MNVTRDVVTDLLPLYFSGEASEDTRRLVETFFGDNPDYERVARAAAQPLESLQAVIRHTAEAEHEKREMQGIAWQLRSRRVWLLMALFLTLWPLASLTGSQLAAWVGGPHTWAGRSAYLGAAVYFWLLYLLRPGRLSVLLAQAIMVTVGETVAILIRLGVIPTGIPQTNNVAVLGVGALAALCWAWYAGSRPNTVDIP